LKGEPDTLSVVDIPRFQLQEMPLVVNTGIPVPLLFCVFDDATSRLPAVALRVQLVVRAEAEPTQPLTKAVAMGVLEGNILRWFPVLINCAKSIDAMSIFIMGASPPPRRLPVYSFHLQRK